MKLIAALTSPYARKVRIVMSEKKLDYQLQLENVWAPDTQIQESNPLGKVPCLITEDGGSLFDSRVIVEYLDTLSPVGRLIPQGGRERAAVKCWEALADGTVDACISIFLENKRPETQRSAEWLDRQYGNSGSFRLDGVRSGRTQPLYGRQLQPGRYCRRLCAWLSRSAFCAHRLA
jgi:glutathione S-transferase